MAEANICLNVRPSEVISGYDSLTSPTNQLSINILFIWNWL